MNKYLKFEYWNTCDLGNIYYQGGQHFIFYLDADVGEPIHEEVEEGQENGDGDFIPTYRRQMKRYRIRTGLIPDYLIDAIQRMKLHDNIELTFKSGEIEQIYNVDCEAEWQFEKYAWQGTVTLTFDMDESITVGACCDNLIIANPDPDPYWVATDGSDETGTGEYSNPWLTLSYAISQVTTGDTINLKAGTYNIATQVVVPVGVSLRGQGSSTILVLTWTTASSSQGCIQLSSYPTEGTNGNQSISHLYLDGDLTGTAAISVYCRSNVKIHDLTVIDFAQAGVVFRGNAATGEATTKATGNQLYNCTITNSSSRTGGVTDGLIRMSSQSGLIIHDNVLTQTGRTTGNNGNIIDGVGGYNDGLQYYNNVSRKPYSEGAQWNFHIEIWNSRGGMNIYDNQFQGGGCHIDIGGDSNTKGSYAYSWWIHDNLFNQDALQAYNADGYYTIAVDLERNVQDAIIERNHIRRLNWGVYLSCDGYSTNLGSENIRISYNIFESIGTTDNLYAAALMISSLETSLGHSNIRFDNNTITAGASFNVGAGIITALYAGTLDNLYIRNNIMKGFMRPMWVDATQNPDTVYYQNNHSNNTSDAIYYRAGRAITDLQTADNQTGDPLFVSATDFHLQAGSPCINAGIDVGLTTDYDGRAVGNPPEIGAYEYKNKT